MEQIRVRKRAKGNIASRIVKRKTKVVSSESTQVGSKQLISKPEENVSGLQNGHRKIDEHIQTHALHKEIEKTRLIAQQTASSPTETTSDGSVKSKDIEEVKHPAQEEEDKEEKYRELYALIRETENFDRSNNEISPFINSPEYVDLICPENNYARNIPLDESRPCSFSVRKEHYNNMLHHFSKPEAITGTFQQYYSYTTNFADLSFLLE